MAPLLLVIQFTNTTHDLLGPLYSVLQKSTYQVPIILWSYLFERFLKVSIESLTLLNIRNLCLYIGHIYTHINLNSNHFCFRPLVLFILFKQTFGSSVRILFNRNLRVAITMFGIQRMIAIQINMSIQNPFKSDLSDKRVS